MKKGRTNVYRAKPPQDGKDFRRDANERDIVRVEQAIHDERWAEAQRIINLLGNFAGRTVMQERLLSAMYAAGERPLEGMMPWQAGGRPKRSVHGLDGRG
jgi:hypothetical protein